MDKKISKPNVLNGLVTVQEASRISGYSKQYIRRVARIGRLEGSKIGNIWLIDFNELKIFLTSRSNIVDSRFGPKMKVK